MADMYLLAFEDDEGFWMHDPRGFDTQIAAESSAKEYPISGCRMVLYRCSYIRDIGGNERSEASEAEQLPSGGSEAGASTKEAGNV